ncbi:ENDO2, partial [Symbiodinium necroappetens]
WTHVRAVSCRAAERSEKCSEWDFDKRKWKEDGAFKSFDRWMEEAVQFSCKKAYTHPLTGQKLAGPDAEGSEPVEIDEAAYQEWRHLWLRQILIAGERTAIVLNDILDNKGAARLATGSKVHTKADEEKAKEQAAWEQERLKRQKEERRTRTSGSLINVGAFMTNLFVAIITVPIFLLVANHGLNPQTYAGLIRSILAGSGNSDTVKGPAKRFE